MSYRQKNNIRLGLILLVVLVAFLWSIHKIVSSQLYYHVTVEQYINDNQSITEAFKEETTMRRHFQHRLAKKKVEFEQQQENLLVKIKENEKQLEKIQIMQVGYSQLEAKYKRVQNERDSLSAIIRSLRRVD